MHLLPEWYDGCMVPWCLYLHTIVCADERGTFRRFEIAPKDEPDLWRSTIIFLRSWLISFDFLMMSNKVALSDVLRLLLGNTDFQLPPKIFYGLEIWRLARPLQDLEMLLTKLCSESTRRPVLIAFSHTLILLLLC